MENEPRQKIQDIIKYWMLMLIFWILSYFEIQFIQKTIANWRDPFYLTEYTLGISRIAEISAFALVIILLIYSFGSTVLLIRHLIRTKFHHIRYHALARMHVLVMVVFIIYWAIYILLFIIFKL